MPNKQPILANRGFLLHITHYDPVWCQAKDKEEPFDLKVGLAVIEAMAAAGLNLLLIDCADGLIYPSHPELTRPYSQPIEILKTLGQYAYRHNLEVVPLLNFAQSEVFQNNHWFRPHHLLFDNEVYWRYAFEIIDELIEATGSTRFFHIGMDEDHWRSHRQYVKAIQTLQAGLAQRHLRTIIWNASALRKPEFEIFKEKSTIAEQEVSKEIVQVIFDYATVQPEVFRRVLDSGFEVWGAPGANPEQVAEMREMLLQAGGAGILLTRWISCIPANRDDLLNHIRMLGPLCSQ